MKKVKSVLCLLLAASTVGWSAGCSQGSGGVKDTNATASAANTKSTVSSVSGPWDKYKPVDLKGRTITIAYNWQHVPATTSEKLDPKKATKTEIKDLANMKRIEKKYNCKIKYINIPYDQLYKKLTASVMAGSPCADLINISASMSIGAAKANMIQSLDDIVPKNCDMLNDQKILTPVKFFGKTYDMSTYDIGTSGAMIGFNRDLIQKLGMEQPDQLYKEGKWDWDHFLNLAKAAKKDTDGDGKTDQWGVGGNPYLLASLFVASNGGYLLDEANKKTGIDDSKTVETFNFVNKLYNVDKVAYLKDVSAKANWYNDGTGDDFKKGNIAMFYIELYMIPTDPKLSYKIGCVPTPKGPSNTTDIGWFKSPSGMTIPKGVKNPKVVYEIYEELSDAYGSDYKARDKEAKEWLGKGFPTEADVDMYRKNSKKCGKIDNAGAIEDYSLNNVVSAFIREGKTPAQAAQQYKQPSQAQIKSKLG